MKPLRLLKTILWPAAVAITISCSVVTNKNQDCRPHPVGLVHVNMSGELAERVQRNFNRMETELYRPKQVFWSEEESGGWPADKEGRTILALVFDSRASAGKRKPLYLDSLIHQLPSHMNEKGYLGSVHTDFIDEQQLSGHGWLLRGLCEYFQSTGDSAALSMAKTIVYNLFVPTEGLIDNYPVDPECRETETGSMSGSVGKILNGWRLSSDVGCVFIGMDGLIHYYAVSGDARLKPIIERMINLFRRIDLAGIKAQTHASLTAMRGLMRYRDITGNDSIIVDVEQRWNTYKSRGMTENFENYNWFDRFDTWTEPCAIIDSYMLAVQLWAATRKPQYLDDAEHIYYNAICATQRDNGGFGCNKPIGPFFNSLQQNCYEAHWCCTMRGGEGLGRAVDYSVFTAADTIFLPFYNTCRIHIPHTAEINVTTAYPRGNTVEIRIDSASSPVLALRLPKYMTVESLSVNGKDAGYKTNRGFAVLDRRPSAGDFIELRYLFSPEVATPVNNECLSRGQCKIMYGPLIMGSAKSGRVLFDHAPTELHCTGNLRIIADCDTLVPLHEICFR